MLVHCSSDWGPMAQQTALPDGCSTSIDCQLLCRPDFSQPKYVRSGFAKVSDACNGEVL